MIDLLRMYYWFLNFINSIYVVKIIKDIAKLINSAIYRLFANKLNNISY